MTQHLWTWSSFPYLPKHTERKNIVIYINRTPRTQSVSKAGYGFSELHSSEAQVTRTVVLPGRMGQRWLVSKEGKVRTPASTRVALFYI